MTTLKYLGGPLDGVSYPLEPGQPIPREIRHTGWRGHYVFRSASGPESPGPLGPHFAWVGK